MSFDSGEYGHDDDPDGAQSDLAVMESNEYKLKRRLKRILDARDKCQEVDDIAFEMAVEGDISEDARNIVVLRAVQEFIHEAWMLLRDHATTDEDGALTSTYLTERELGGIEFESRRPIVFRGLADILHADESYPEAWTETVRSRHGGAEVVKRSQTHYVPRDVSWAAYRLTCEFLAEEHDIMLQFEDVDDNIPTREPVKVEDAVAEEYQRFLEELDEKGMGNGEATNGEAEI